MGKLKHLLQGWLFIFKVYSMAQSTEKFPQNLPTFCNPTWNYCPTDDNLPFPITPLCCRGNDKTTNLDFHCQEVRVLGETTRLELACLPSITCHAGSVPVVEKEQGADNVTLASVQCRQCQPGYFEPHTNISSRHRFPTCQRKLQTCKHGGKTLAKKGNSTHDNLCRCLTSQEYFPFPDTLECKSVHGFSNSSGCGCRKKYSSNFAPGILNPGGSKTNDSMTYMGFVGAVMLLLCVLAYGSMMVYKARCPKRGVPVRNASKVEFTVKVPTNSEAEQASLMGVETREDIPASCANGSAHLMKNTPQ